MRRRVQVFFYVVPRKLNSMVYSFLKEFHVAFVLLTMGNSPRPEVWVLERSTDHGNTWQPWQYFADPPSDCTMLFNVEPDQPITKDDDVLCTSKYSRIVPLEGGEVRLMGTAIVYLALLITARFSHRLSIPDCGLIG